MAIMHHENPAWALLSHLRIYDEVELADSARAPDEQANLLVFLGKHASARMLLEARVRSNPGPTNFSRGQGVWIPSGEPVTAVSPLMTRDRILTERAESVVPDHEGESSLGRLMTAVRDQHLRPTCVAFAAAAVREAYEVANGRRRGAVDASEQYLYCAAKDIDGDEESGTALRNGFVAMRDYGLCAERYWPYNPSKIRGNEGQGPPPDEAHEDAGRYGIGSFARLKLSVDTIKRKVDAEHPVALAVKTWPLWTRAVAVQTGDIMLPIPGTTATGAHAVCVYGYRDGPEPGGGVFLFKNSWGTDWGAAGHGTVPYRYVELYALEAYRITA